MNWYLDVFKKYAVFEGRARRKEYWFFLLFNFLITLGLVLVDGVTGTTNPAAFGLGLLSGIYTLAVLIPGIAVSVRRFHDIGKSGWLLMLAFIPFVGGLVIFVFMLQDSQPGQNEYGPSPKMATA